MTASPRRKAPSPSSRNRSHTWYGWIPVFLIWSTWMFVLGVMAAKDMAPDYLKLGNLINWLSPSRAQESVASLTGTREDPELSNPRLEFFENLGHPPVQGSSLDKKEQEHRYTVQIASLKTTEQAQVFIDTLKKQGVAGESHPVTSQGVTWYAIRSGEFGSFQDAKTLAQELTARCGYKPLVIQLQK